MGMQPLSQPVVPRPHSVAVCLRRRAGDVLPSGRAESVLLEGRFIGRSSAWARLVRRATRMFMRCIFITIGVKDGKRSNGQEK